MQSINDGERSSGSEKEDHIEADPTYETESNEDLCSSTAKSLPVKIIIVVTLPDPLNEIDVSLPGTPTPPSQDQILKPLRPTLRGKNKRKWFSINSKVQSKTASRNIVHIILEPTRFRKLN